MRDEPTYDELKLRVKELEQNEKYYRLIADNATDMISKHDPDGVYIYASPACRDFTGYTSDELIGQSAYDFIHPEDLSNIKTFHREICRAPVIHTVSYRFKQKQGNYIWVEATSKTINNQDTGDVEGIIAITRDITARKLAEESLARRSELERLIIKISSEFLGLNSEGMDKGIERALAVIGSFSGADRAYVFLFQEDGLLADNTHEWCAEGIEPQIDNLKGIPVNQELPWFGARINKCEVFALPDVAELPAEARAEREHFQVQGILSLIAVPMVSGDRLLGFIGFDAVSEKRTWEDEDLAILQLFGEVLTNAIERKWTEEELHQSEARWQFALEGAGDGVWDWDPLTDRIYFSVKCKAMFGYTEQEIGDTLVEWENRVHPDDMPAVRAELERHFSRESEIYKSEHRILCKDGSYKWILARGKVIEWTPDEKPRRMIGTNTDISERKMRGAERARLIIELQEALSKVKQLSGLLPICASCKKIRDDKGYWSQIESYIKEHSEADFSHSICPECAKKLYPDLE